MAKVMRPVVIDLSHHNEVEDFAAVYKAGIRGVIHKATQGASYVDLTCRSRRDAAKKAGLLWGYYHFGTNDDVKAQVDNFLKVAKIDDQTLLALDFEDNRVCRRNSCAFETMSLAQAKEFLKLVYERTGQRPIIYSGSLLKECLGKKADPFLSQHRLWLAQYGPRAKLPAGFKSYWLWQYSDGVHGPEPRSCPGIKGHVDMNVYSGKDLAADWVHMPSAPAADVIPERAGTKVSDLKGKAATVDLALTARKVGIGLAGAGAAVGAGNETVAPVVPPADPSVLSSDGLSKAADTISSVHTIADTATTTWHILSQNTWMLAMAGGIGVAVLAHLLLGKERENYILGLLHLRDE